MPNWLVSRDPPEKPKNEECSERIDADRKMNAEKMNAENGTCEDAERGNVKKENTRKEYEDAGNARRRIGRWQGDARAKLPKEQEGLLLSPDDASDQSRKHAGGSQRMGDVGRATAEQDAMVRRVAVPAVGARVERDNAQRGVCEVRAVLGEVGLMARRRR